MRTKTLYALSAVQSSRWGLNPLHDKGKQGNTLKLSPLDYLITGKLVTCNLISDEKLNGRKPFGTYQTECVGFEPTLHFRVLTD